MKVMDSKMVDLDIPDINKPKYDGKTEVSENIKTCETEVDMSFPATSDISLECKPEIDFNLKTQSPEYPQIDQDRKLMKECDNENAFEVDIPSNKVSKTFNDTVSIELPQNYMQYIPDSSEFEVPKANVPEISMEQPIEDSSPKTTKKSNKTKDSGKRKPDFGLKIPEKITSLVHKLSFKGGDKNRLKSADNLTASEPILYETKTLSGTEMSPKTKDKTISETEKPTKKASKKRSKFRLKKKQRSTSSSSSSSSESEDEKKKNKIDMNHADKEVQVNVFKVDLKTKTIAKPDGKQSKKKKHAKEEPSTPTTPESPFDKLSHIFHRTHKAKITEPIKEDKKKEKEKKENKKSPSRSSSDNRDRSTSQTSTDEQTTKSDVCHLPENEDDKDRHNKDTDDKSPLKTLQEYSKLLDKQVARTRPETDDNINTENKYMKGTSDDENLIKQDKVPVPCSVEELVVEEKIERVESAQKSSSESVSSDNDVVIVHDVERKASLSSLEREIFPPIPQN
ncbi:uncharacterized protein LOC143073800 [Mytilus galloprovincialis]|uniref:uncharacterized protein LOC143073800 n=1 Tax=Mytilus galloprovincialis TaxID=29158 RepID=UPI003F7CA8FA